VGVDFEAEEEKGYLGKRKCTEAEDLGDEGELAFC
jgi:hypothetical protein